MKRWMKNISMTMTAAMVVTSLPFGVKNAKAQTNQTLNWSVASELETLDPQKSVDSTSSTMLENSYEGLYRYNKKGQVVNALATDTKKSADGLTYTIKIRKGAHWSNGQKVTANDFVYAWQRSVDPKTADSNANLFGNFKNAPDIMAGKKNPKDLGVTAKDDYTIVVNLDAQIPYFKSLTCSPTFLPVNEAAVKKFGKKFGTKAQYAVYNGPFKMTKWTGSTAKWTLKKNDKYWDKSKVKLNTINVLVTKESSTAYNLFQTKKLDMVMLSNQQARNLKHSKEFVIRKQARTSYLEMNKKNEILANKNIRTALGYAIDRKSLVDKVLGNGSSASKSIAPDDFMAHDGKQYSDMVKSGISNSYDLKKAKKYWQKGMKELGKDSITLELLGDDDDTTKAINEYLQSKLQSNLKGLKISVKSVPKTQRITREQSGDFELVYTSWGANYADAITFLNLFTKDSAYNFGKWDNAKYNELVQKSETTDASNANKRWNDMVEAEKVLFDDAAIATLLQAADATMMRSTVKNVTYNSVGGYNWKKAYIQ